MTTSLTPPATNVVHGAFLKAREDLPGGPTPGTVILAEPGRLQVNCPGLGSLPCDVLDAAGLQLLAPGEAVLVLVQMGESPRGIVLGRVSAYRHEAAPSHLEFKSTESMTLQCGDSSVELRADGKLMIKGDDVLVRAKGTQRIRAGTVSIN